MAGETVITIVGNLTADPELRFTQSGATVVDFTVASTPRTYDRNAGEWRDGDTLFMRCSAWRDMADNIAESLRKGMRVIVQGRLTQRSFEDRNGQQRTVVEMQVDEAGPSLRRAKATVERVPPQGGYAQGGYQGGNRGGAPDSGYQGANRGGSNQGYQGGGSPQASYGAPAGGTVDDPWRASSQGDAAFGEPPF
ncbi:single-stranded DNA-binding protein [Actinomyces mediterranea]|uniref:single-stranded DNA-binding protein n=1 Tax=Actinomyces mediterranea TaxID=1871028 RepID=UPI0009705CC3|nr:single-stranded DNA-binding protein [Actinomyces mediterranea]